MVMASAFDLRSLTIQASVFELNKKARRLQGESTVKLNSRDLSLFYRL